MEQDKKPTRGNGRNPQPLSVIELPDALVRLETLAQASGLSISTLYRKVAEGKLTLVKEGARCTRVRSGVCREFIKSLGGA